MKDKRELTEKEKIRAEKIQNIIEEKEKKGYKKLDLTISITKANVMAFVLCIPICIPFTVLFLLQNSVTSLEFSDYMILCVSFIVLTVIHELIHGFFWGMFAKNHYRSIEFGFIAELLTPYCTCLEPLKKGQYIVGCIMPGVLLGLIPMLISAFSGSFLLLIVGVVMTLGAGGDLTILLKLIPYKGNSKTIYLDHPYECGLIVLEK